MENSNTLLPLKGVAQNYAWGHIGRESAVARLISASESVEPSRPYAGTLRPYTGHPVVFHFSGVISNLNAL